MKKISKLFMIPLLVLTFQGAQAQEPLTVKSKGRAPSSKLSMKSSKVPTFAIHKAKDIPRLDIGEEAQVEMNQYSLDIPPKELKAWKVNKQESPKLVKMDLKNFLLPMKAPKLVIQLQALTKIPTVRDLKPVDDPEMKDAEAQPKTLITMKEADYKILEALIYLDDHKNFEQALALLAEIMQSNDYKYESLFLYALTAQAMKLNTEFRANMFAVAKNSKDASLRKLAVQSLVDNVESLEITDVKDLEPLVDQMDIDTTNKDAYNFYRAKYFLEDGDLGQVENALLFIPEKSKYYGDALLVTALLNYRTGKIDETIYSLTRLAKLLKSENSLQGIGALTLARAYFQKGMYKEASQAYLIVNKGDPLWMQAMVEQAWTQILLQDYVGAAGNMFTLHTDYFKNAFAPDSYVVRTVGYLNLCQYGDGLQVLNSLHRKYGPFRERLQQYSSSRKNNMAYYETVKSWLKNSEQREMDGLPRNFIVELARHPSFMKIQTQINNFEDELEGFDKATIAILQREKTLLQKQSEAKDELVKIQKQIREAKVESAELKLSTAFQNRRIAAYQMQYQLTHRSRALIKGLRERAIVRIDKEKVELRDKAGKALKDRLKTIVADLSRILDQNDVLQYELFSGAGEHLRYQMAGGETKNKDRKAASEKQVSWKFKGEIWEDEVGHVRSSLENVCAKDDASVAATDGK